MKLAIFVFTFQTFIFSLPALRIVFAGPQCKIDNFGPRNLTAAQTRWNKALPHVKGHQLTFLPDPVLNMHQRLIDSIESENVPGWIIETGVAKGGSALLLAARKRQDRCLHLYDTFEGIPPPSDRDGLDVHQRYSDIQKGRAGDNYYGYMTNLLDFVRQQFDDVGFPATENNIEFHKGLFNETLGIPADGKIAYAHLDGDWYDSTMCVMERVVPKLSLHGVMILDDALSWSGAHDAFQDFFDVNLKHVKSGSILRKDGSTFEISTKPRVYVRRTS